MGHQFTPLRSDAKSTSHGKNAQRHDHTYLESTFLPRGGRVLCMVKKYFQDTYDHVFVWGGW